MTSLMDELANLDFYFIASTLLIAYFVSCILQRIYIFRTFKRMDIPGPKPSFLTGNTFEYLDDPVGVLGKWREKYGNVFGYFYGPRPYLCISDLDMITDILVRKFTNFKDRPDMPVAANPVADSVVHLTAPKWKPVRDAITPAFTQSKINKMSRYMNESVDILVEEIDNIKDKPFDIYKLVQGLTMDVIGKCALAMNVDCIRNQKEPLLVSTREYLNNALNSAVKMAVIFPSLGRIMAFLYNWLAAGKFTEKIVGNLMKAITYRRRNPQQNAQDLLQLMMDSLGDKEVVGSCFAFVVAGYETTANALACTFYLLAKHQDIQESLYEEIKDLPDPLVHEDVKRIHLLGNIFRESMRMYPPVVTFISRKAMKTTEVSYLKIPKGVAVQIPIYQIHHDPDYWQNPDEFNPSRFEIKGVKNSAAFLPFGKGPRNCVGSLFASLEAKIALIKVIRKFKISLCQESEDPLTFAVPTVTLNPKNGVIVKAEIRP